MSDRVAQVMRRGVRNVPVTEEEAARRRAIFKEQQEKAHQDYLESQAAFMREQREAAEREAAEREAKRAAQRAEEQARVDAFNAARAREDVLSPFGPRGPQNTGRDIRIAMAKLYIDVWHDELTGVDRIDGLDDYRNGSKLDKQTLGALLVQLSDAFAFTFEPRSKVKPTLGLLEKTVRAQAQTTRCNGVMDYIGTASSPPAKDTGLNSWLIQGLGAPDTPLNRAASRAWTIDAVRCARHPERLPSIVLAFEGCDPYRIAVALSNDYPPFRDFLLERMIEGQKGHKRSARRLPVRCGQIDLDAVRSGVGARWRDAAYYEASGESVDLTDQIEKATDSFERVTNPFVSILEEVLGDAEGKVRTADVIQVLGLDAGEMADCRDARNGQLNRAMEMLGWGKRRAVRWDGAVVKGWGKGASTASLRLERSNSGGWDVR